MRPPAMRLLQLVLHRTDRHLGKDDKSDGTKNRVGLVVTRVQPPPPENPRRRKPGQPRTNALGETVRKSSVGAWLFVTQETAEH